VRFGAEREESIGGINRLALVATRPIEASKPDSKAKRLLYYPPTSPKWITVYW
jgi:hypothetical protein